MSAPTPVDTGGEDVNDFLQRIKQLGDTRDQEDEDRNKKLEEEILQSRKERQARRAERARSISPTKSSPASTPTTSRISAEQTNTLSQASSPKFEPQGASEPRAIDDAMERLTGTVRSPTSPSKDSEKENASPFDGERPIFDSSFKRDTSMKASPSNAMPSRSSTLSWQRRPNSQASDRPRSRPLSMVATENAAKSPRATPEPSSFTTDPTPSRDQIAQSLASKDPAWFRQTADRGQSSPAYRRSQVEDEDRSDHGSSSGRVQMPGMLKDNTESNSMAGELVNRSISPSTSSASYGSGSRASYQASPNLAGGLGSPMTPAQRLDPPTDQKSEGRGLAMSPTQGRISPDRLDRPASPTKGMGGFVQSAMMKRSDSVNKRWSVQSPPGLTRGDSVASNRSSVDRGSNLSLGGIINSTVREPKPSTLSRENSPHPGSRPTSSHSNATLTQDRPGTSNSVRSSLTTSTTNDGFVKPTLPVSRTQTPTPGVKTGQNEPGEETPMRVDTTPPSSPSKTMDPRRWSPTKSSWLESALNKPESPKPKPVAPPQQPAWMAEINKAKQKGSVDLGRSPTSGPKHEVNIGGLMRSPPPGGLVKPLSIGGLPTGFSSGSIKQRPDSVTSLEIKQSESFSDTSSPTPAYKSSPATGKIKPDTPPKKDFRANLKPRQVPTDNGGSSEPEFKNVFGQLRRTKTQNYVAPDELKDNITRGKAALNLTGGPKKTERKDEFKEAILKKKEDFKKAQLDGKGVTRSASGGSQDSPLPEALAKRQAMGRSDSIVSETGSLSFASPKKAPESPRLGLVKETSAPARLQAKELPTGKLAGRLNPGLAGLLARGPPPMSGETSRALSPQSLHTNSTSTSKTEPTNPGPQLTHMTKARARGPRRKAPTNMLPSTPSIEPSAATETTIRSGAQEEVPKKTPPEIEIKQKTAAPPRMSPTKSEVGSPVSQPASPRKLDMKRRSQFLQDVPNLSKPEPQLEPPKPLSPKQANSPEISVKPLQTMTDSQSAPAPKPKPSTPTKSPSLTTKHVEMTSASSDIRNSETLKLIPSPLSPSKPASVAQSPSADSPETAKLRPAPLSPTKPTKPTKTSKIMTAIDSTLEQKEMSAEAPKNRDSLKSVKNVAAMWDHTSTSKTVNTTHRPKSPIKLPTQEDEKAALVGAGLRSLSPVRNFPTNNPVNQTTRVGGSRPLPVTPTNGPLSPSPSSGLQSPRSPTKAASEASTLLADFFIGRNSPPKFLVDTATLLSIRPDQGLDIKTLRSTLYQFSSDGKKQQVPSHQERILFEGNLYLCTHTFGNAAGKKLNEVYFWHGDDVPHATVDDFATFALREAKAYGGRLITIRQGKETPEFFHALGGIVIVRRGSSIKYDSLAPHILCGRKHFGQIVFDEVDFSSSSLCSGFPYLISTQSGKSYLWKGKGSGIDELSCARLIGMDFGLTGEIEEVEDGNEPASFLQIFRNDKIPTSAGHWRMKPNYNKYSVRLFVANSTSKQQVTEISPFCQCDLEVNKIFILDAFFEIYIIVGSSAQSEYPAFHHALMFAQEYGILAAGMEDRPYVPVTTVVLEGVPRDMQKVFRKWVPGLAPTLHKPPPSGGLTRWKSLRVLPLNAALEATRT